MKSNPTQEAARAHSDLNTFATIVTILEGGHIYLPKSHDVAERIIALCKGRQEECLNEYDDAVSSAQPKAAQDE